MKASTIFAAVAAFLPAAMACNGFTGGVPKAVGTKTNKAVIEVKAGQVFAWKPAAPYSYAANAPIFADFAQALTSAKPV